MLKMCAIFRQPYTHHPHWNEHECYAIMVKENYTTNSCCCFIFNFMHLRFVRRSVYLYGVVHCALCTNIHSHKDLDRYTGDLSINKRANLACRPIWYVCMCGAIFWFSWKMWTERLLSELKSLPNEIVSYYTFFCCVLCVYGVRAWLMIKGYSTFNTF